MITQQQHVILSFHLVVAEFICSRHARIKSATIERKMHFSLFHRTNVDSLDQQSVCTVVTY